MRRSAQKDKGGEARPSPAVPEIIALMEEDRGALVAELRSQALTLPGAEERAVYDGFCREWTPAYYFGGRQLFHVHNFRAGLRATMFIGVRTLEPVILDSDEVAEEIRLEVAKTTGHHGTKMVKVPIESTADVATFMDMVRVKWNTLGGG